MIREDKRTLTELNAELSVVNAKIKRLTPSDDYFNRLSSSFHLGMVGGSGRNVRSLNRRRERSLDKTIDNAVILTGLYRERDLLENKIKDIEDGGPGKRAEARKKGAELRAEYWRMLKVGDELEVGGNTKPVITKKNKKSCETGIECKWTAAEIIGKDAAALL